MSIPSKSILMINFMKDISSTDLSFRKKSSSDLQDFKETPLPDSDRAIYGFAFYILNWTCFILYFIWVFTPYSFLEYLNLTFFPSKYYGLCLPLLIPFGIAVYIGGVFIYNIISFQEIDDKEVYLEDDFAGECGGSF